METDFLTLVHDLGPPEGTKVAEPLKPDEKAMGKKGSIIDKGKTAPQIDEKGHVKKKETLEGKTQEQIENTIFTKTLDVLMNLIIWLLIFLGQK